MRSARLACPATDIGKKILSAPVGRIFYKSWNIKPFRRIFKASDVSEMVNFRRSLPVRADFGRRKPAVRGDASFSMPMQTARTTVAILDFPELIAAVRDFPVEETP